MTIVHFSFFCLLFSLFFFLSHCFSLLLDCSNVINGNSSQKLHSFLTTSASSLNKKAGKEHISQKGRHDERFQRKYEFAVTLKASLITKTLWPGDTNNWRLFTSVPAGQHVAALSITPNSGVSLNDGLWCFNYQGASIFKCSTQVFFCLLNITAKMLPIVWGRREREKERTLLDPTKLKVVL